MNSGFEVVLVSTENNESFPCNRNFRFSNDLAKKVNLGMYQIALNYISYYDNYKTGGEQEIAQVTEPSTAAATGDDEEDEEEEITSPFFDLGKNENEIFVEQTVLDELTIIKYNASLDNFVNTLNTKLQTEKFPIQVEKRFGDGETIQEKLNSMQLKLKYTDEATRELELPEPLNRILGFTPTRFSPGEYDSDKQPDFELFNSYQFNQVIGSLTIYRRKRQTLKLDQLEDNPLASTIALEIVKTLTDAKINTSFHVKKSDSTIEYETGPLIRLMLSEKLCEYLGLEKHFVFHGSGTIKIPENIVIPPPPENIEPAKLPHKPIFNNKILILCDGVAPQSFASKEIPLLALFDRVPSDDTIQHTYQPARLLYKECVSEIRGQLTVSILTETLEHLPFTDKPTFISLYLRKKLLDGGGRTKEDYYVH